MKLLFVVHDPPYGTERAYNAIRLARMLAMRPEVELKMFLVADGVGCAIDNQKVPKGYYNLGDMAESIGRHGGVVGCCGSCMDARGFTDEQLVKGARRSSLEEWADWVLWADKTIAF
jgi:uncharacterized protein involved in oxidation of intracellular sulfur